MKNFRFIFLRLCIYLIAGILLAFYMEISRQVLMITGGVILCFFLFSFFRSGKLLFPDDLFGIASFLLIFYLGFFIAYFNIPENQPDHYIKQNIELTDSLIITGKISEELKPTAFSERFIMEAEGLISGDSEKSIHGKVLVNVFRDSTNKDFLRPGMRIMVPWKPEAIKAPLNPFQFSYSRYMKQLKVEQQLNLDPSKISISSYDPSFRDKAWNLRERLIQNLKNYNFGKDEIAVFQALILGQRRDISTELYRDYAAAGAIHILAISGLHIGILLLFLNFLFKPIENLKYGRFIKPVIVIILLWSFAILSGLSASVVRAVFMFSFIAVGLQLKRKTSSLNSLFLSLFFLLILDSYYIFQVGFQLSYLAVLSIIVFQPMIYQVFSPNNKVIDYIWKLSSVSLAAQIGVIPLSIYYFHQFPGLFLLTNLVVLPFLGILLALGILVIILAAIQILPVFIEESFGKLLNSLNLFIEKVADLDQFVISNIQLDLLQTIVLYLIILAVVLMIRKINFERLSFFLISILLFQVVTIYAKANIPAREAIVFHRSKASIFGIKETSDLKVYSEGKVDSTFLIDYLRERNIERLENFQIPKILEFSNKLILVIDTAGNYNLKQLKPELLILRNSPKINLERLLNNISPEEVIADGSNYFSFISRWKVTAENKKIPFHYTGEKGAYVLKQDKQN
ncbi:competence protein ComEC [Christiangramia gaetbulicola]|uniref:Competence protein ComEC n=1 Tax=Christiangramia gaetbulicola TaxID=703340 RepID=A0A2T6AD01_9FLAO|nr:ComEC/Rec2 family competence protein [Christiangramia gaetbulicola]PTX41693.1 competence protein ComEC [Christiangramia gaetbulicola]